MSKYTKGQVIHISFPHKSFSWADGLYVFLKQKNDELHIVNIKKDGSLSLFEDGRLMYSCTGINNPGITTTNLTFDLSLYTL